MTSFWFFSALLLLLALLFVVVPVLRYRPVAKTADSDIRKQKNIEVFRQSLEELEQDKKDNLVSAEEFENLKIELERSFLRDMEDEKKRRQGETTRSGKLIPLLALLFVPVFSYSMYQFVGSARDLVLPDIMENLSNAETAEEQLAVLNDLADFLQQRFDRKRDDIRNGYMLGTLYLELERYPEAIATFTDLLEEMEDGPDKATVLGQLAQSMYLVADSQITPEVQDVIDQALAMNPNEYAVMSLLAIEAFINEDYNQAVSYWRRQLSQMDVNSQQYNNLRSRIAQVEAMITASGGELDTGAAAGGAEVTLVIDIDESVKNLVNDSMTLYVFARRAAGGPPVAARNLPVQEFPFQITLDDSMAMIAGNNLSSADSIYVGARLSRTGNAIAQSGDIQAESEPFALKDQTEPVMLTIKDIVP